MKLSTKKNSAVASLYQLLDASFNGLNSITDDYMREMLGELQFLLDVLTKPLDQSHHELVRLRKAQVMKKQAK